MIKIVYLLLTIRAIVTQQPQIIDFSYAQLLHTLGTDGHGFDDLVIRPNLTERNYEFPQVCDLLNKLTDSEVEGQTDITPTDPDILISDLKGQILNLLRLAEQIKNSRANIKELSQYLNPYHQRNSSIYISQIDSLQKDQQQLAILKNKITNLTDKLNIMIQAYNSQSQTNQFLQAKLKFDIQAYTQKIDYLTNLKTKNSLPPQPNFNYEKFFEDLKVKFAKQQSILAKIDEILLSYNQIGQLKSQANALNSSISALTLYIEQKEQCKKEKDNIRESTTNNAPHIKSSIQELRKLKELYANTTNKYCQGVVKKLYDQIIKQLKFYNWIYQCTEGFDELVADRDREMAKLRSIQEKIKGIEEQGIDQYQRRYNEARESALLDLNTLSKFKVGEYHHSPNQIDKLIDQAIKSKSETSYILKNIPQRTVNQISYNQIRDLVEEIKQQKARYCQKYEQYERKSKQIWKSVKIYEDEERFASKMKGLYLEEGRRLIELERLYSQKSQIIIARLRQ